MLKKSEGLQAWIVRLHGQWQEIRKFITTMKKSFGIFLFVITCITFAVIVKAATISLPMTQDYTSLANVPATAAGNPCSTVINFYGFALFISGILAFGAIVYGGIRYAVSAGNPSGQSEGIDWIKGALFGILLLASAYILLNIVNPALVKCQLPTLPKTPLPICIIGEKTLVKCTCKDINNGGEKTCPSGKVCRASDTGINIIDCYDAPATVPLSDLPICTLGQAAPLGGCNCGNAPCASGKSCSVNVVSGGSGGFQCL